MNGLDIRIARLRAGMRQYDLADRLGIRNYELSLLETGRKPIPQDLIPRICTILEGYIALTATAEVAYV